MGPPGRDAYDFQRIMNLCLNNPFGRHVFIMNDLDNDEDQERFLNHMQALSQEKTNECTDNTFDSPQVATAGLNTSNGDNLL